MKTLKDPIKCTITTGSSVKSLSVTRKSVGEQPMRTEEQVKLAINSILDNKYLNRNYKDEVVDILAWVLGGDMFDGLEGKSWDYLNNEPIEHTSCQGCRYVMEEDETACSRCGSNYSLWTDGGNQ